MAPRPGFIDETAKIGMPPEHRDWTPEHGDRGVEIDPSAQINSFVTVDAGFHGPTRVGARTFLMTKTHLGHDAQVGADCELAPGTVIGGHCVLGDGVRCGVGVMVRPRVRVGAGAHLGAGAVVVRDVPAGETWVGNPARRLWIAKPLGETMTESEREGWEDVAVADDARLEAFEPEHHR